MAAKALSEFGRVDILVNNAAIRPHKPFTELTVADWEYVRGVVLDGALYLTRAVIDLDGQEQVWAHPVLYRRRALSPAAAAGPTSRRRRWAWSGWPAAWPRNSRRTTSGSMSCPPAASIPGGTIPSGITGACRRRRHPPRPPGHVDEIAATCLFLVSDDGGFITGQTIHVNGGAAYY